MLTQNILQLPFPELEFLGGWDNYPIWFNPAANKLKLEVVDKVGQGYIAFESEKAELFIREKRQGDIFLIDYRVDRPNTNSYIGSIEIREMDLFSALGLVATDDYDRDFTRRLLATRGKPGAYIRRGRLVNFPHGIADPTRDHGFSLVIGFTNDDQIDYRHLMAPFFGERLTRYYA